MINEAALSDIRMALPASEIDEIIRLAGQMENIEKKWLREIKKREQKARNLAIDLLNKETLPTAQDLNSVGVEEFLLRHFIEVSEDAIKQTKRGISRRSKLMNLAKSKNHLPKSLKELRKIWDAWRKGGKLPPKIKKQAHKIKGEYLKKVRSVWEQYSEPYRSGDIQTQQEISRYVANKMASPLPRASTVVQTETTRYYNQVRREIYDQSEDVTHYLFVAIRDQATTKWCKTRTGLVYKKGDPLLDTETPAIHWGCRSELLPLSPLNPAHLKIIQDISRDRRKHKCEPLPAGWNAA